VNGEKCAPGSCKLIILINQLIAKHVSLNAQIFNHKLKRNKRTSRPEQRPQRQQRPVAPTAAPTAPDTWSPATQRAAPGACTARHPANALYTPIQRKVLRIISPGPKKKETICSRTWTLRYLVLNTLLLRYIK